MKRIIRLLFGLALLCSLTGTAGSATYIEVTAPGNRLLRLAIVPSQPLGGTVKPELANEMAEAQVFDLTMSGLFTAERREAAPLPQGLGLSVIDYIPWLSAGYDLLIRGEYELRGDELTVEFRLFDVLSKRPLLIKRYLGSRTDLRRFSHSFVDELLATLAGERGPFSSRILFVSTQSGNKEIFAMDWDGHHLQQITKSGAITISPDVSPDGREIIFTSYKRGNPDLYKRALSSSVDVPLSTRPGVNITGAWSPDGTKIALGLSKDGNTELYLINRDGSAPERLTVTQAANLSPSWSPDGSKIAFVSDRLGRPHIFIMDANGGNVRRLTTNAGNNFNPAWSPKGDKIAYTHQAGGFQIFVINTDGSGDTQLTTEGSNERPRWSPDGRLIAFSSKRGGNEAIYVMRADGSGQTKVSRSGGNSTHPVWTPHH